MESQGHRNSKKNRKKAGLLRLSDVNTNYSIAVIKTNVDGTRASEK